MVRNLNTNLSFQLGLQYISIFDELILKGLNNEQKLIAKGSMQYYNQLSSSSNKPHFWAKNKNVTNDDVVDAKVVIKLPLSSYTHKKKKFQNANAS